MKMHSDGNSIIAGDTKSAQVAVGRPPSTANLVNDIGLIEKTFTISPQLSQTGRTVDDVAAYILSKTGAMSAMKLQKLLYYSQAWSLVWDDRPLFPERIEAWANGPVIPDLYTKHKGQFDIQSWSYGNPISLDDAAKETVDAVLEYYAPHNAQWLSDLAHSERPWREARAGLAEGERGNREITLESMMEFYSTLSINNA